MEEAKVIDVDMTPMSGADVWLAKVNDKVEAARSKYNAYKIENSDQYSQAKRERTAVRKDIAEVENERKALTRAIDDAVKSFRDRTKDVIKPLTDLDDAYKHEIDDYEDRVLSRRKAELVETYEEMAPLMAIPPEDRSLVLFDRIVQKYGMGRQGRKKWFLYGTGTEDAKEQLVDALKDIQNNEATISKMVSPSMVNVARAIYFDTLDLAATLTEIRTREEQMARLAALDEERKAIEEWESEPVPEPTPEPTPEPVRDESVWVFAGYGTREQAQAFARFCELNGITRHVEKDSEGRSYVLSVKE